MARYIKMVLDTAFVGTQNIFYMDTNMNDRELDAYCADEALQNAADYDYLVLGWGVEPEDYAEDNGFSVEEAEQMLEDYANTALENSYWEEVDEQEYLENGGE